METPLEHLLTTSYKADSISYLKSHPEDFTEAINLAVTDKQPYSWRAAWLLWSCMEKNDKRVQPYVNRIIAAIPKRGENQQRELFIILQKMELTKRQEGVLFNTCVNVWEQLHKQASVRVNAFKLIVKITKKYPDLWNEVTVLTRNEYLETLSPAVKKAVVKLMQGLRKDNRSV